MTGTVHEFPSRRITEAGQQAEALPLPLPTHPHEVDLVLSVERMRAASESLLSILRVSTGCTEANRQMLNQFLDVYFKACEANDALESILSCKGQA